MISIAICVLHLWVKIRSLPCFFDEDLNIYFRHQFVLGLRDEYTQWKEIREKDLTFFKNLFTLPW